MSETSEDDDMKVEQNRNSSAESGKGEEYSMRVPAQRHQKDESGFSHARLKNRVGNPDVSESPTRDD